MSKKKRPDIVKMPRYGDLGFGEEHQSDKITHPIVKIAIVLFAGWFWFKVIEGAINYYF